MKNKKVLIAALKGVFAYTEMMVANKIQMAKRPK